MNDYLVCGHSSGWYVKGDRRVQGLTLETSKDRARMPALKALDIIQHLNQRKTTPAYCIKHHTEV